MALSFPSQAMAPAAGLGDDQIERRRRSRRPARRRPPGRRSSSRRAAGAAGRGDRREGHVVEAGAIAQPVALRGRRRAAARARSRAAPAAGPAAARSTWNGPSTSASSGRQAMEHQRPAPPLHPRQQRLGTQPVQRVQQRQGVDLVGQRPEQRHPRPRRARAAHASACHAACRLAAARDVGVDRRCARARSSRRSARLRSARSSLGWAVIERSGKEVAVPPKPFRRGRPWDLLRRWAPCDVTTVTPGTAPVGTN